MKRAGTKENCGKSTGTVLLQCDDILGELETYAKKKRYAIWVQITKCKNRNLPRTGYEYLPRDEQISFRSSLSFAMECSLSRRDAMVRFVRWLFIKMIIFIGTSLRGPTHLNHIRVWPSDVQAGNTDVDVCDHSHLNRITEMIHTG